MPDTSSYPKTMQDLKKLRAATEERKEALGDVAQEMQKLDEAVQEAEELKAKSDSLATERLDTTYKLEQAVMRAREAGMVLRAAAKMRLGPRSEFLVQFGIAPLRLRLRKPRSRKRKEEPTSSAPVETATETAKKREAA
jgi:DNA repair ATPase RecN